MEASDFIHRRDTIGVVLNVSRGFDGFEVMGNVSYALDPEENEIRVIRDLVQFDGKQVLEIGAGDGRLTRRFAGDAAEVLALDPNEARVEQARRTMPAEVAERVRFQVGDITVLALPAASFDVAVLSWSI